MFIDGIWHGFVSEITEISTALHHETFLGSVSILEAAMHSSFILIPINGKVPPSP